MGTSRACSELIMGPGKLRCGLLEVQWCGQAIARCRTRYTLTRAQVCARRQTSAGLQCEAGKWTLWG